LITKRFVFLILILCILTTSVVSALPEVVDQTIIQSTPPETTTNQVANNQGAVASVDGAVLNLVIIQTCDSDTQPVTQVARNLGNDPTDPAQGPIIGNNVFVNMAITQIARGPSVIQQGYNGGDDPLAQPVVVIGNNARVTQSISQQADSPGPVIQNAGAIGSNTGNYIQVTGNNANVGQSITQQGTGSSVIQTAANMGPANSFFTPGGGMEAAYITGTNANLVQTIGQWATATTGLASQRAWNGGVVEGNNARIRQEIVIEGSSPTLVIQSGQNAFDDQFTGANTFTGLTATQSIQLNGRATTPAGLTTQHASNDGMISGSNGVFTQTIVAGAEGGLIIQGQPAMRNYVRIWPTAVTGIRIGQDQTLSVRGFGAGSSAFQRSVNEVLWPAGPVGTLTQAIQHNANMTATLQDAQNIVHP